MTMQYPQFWRHWKLLAGSLATLMLLALIPSTAAAQTAGDRETRVHYSLYYENFKNEQYEAALPDLRWIIEHAPTFPNNDDRNYERLVEVYEGLAEAAQSESAKQAYLDSALTVISTAVPKLQEAGVEASSYEWTLRKGRFLQTHAEAFPEKQDAMLAAYREAFEMAPQKIDPYYLNRLLRAYVNSDQQQEAVAFLETLEQERADDEEVATLIDKWSNRVFTKPAERIAYLEGELVENPNNVEVMTELFELYQLQNMRQKASQLAAQLIENNPSPDILRTVARMRLEDGQAQEAFSLYQEAVAAMEGTPSAELYYNMGLAQQRMGQFSKARTYFRKALDADSNFGRAYLAIGDLYATSVSQCSGGQLQLADRAVYWTAVDMYQRAAAVDPSVSNIASQKISTYRAYFPTSEALFFQDMSEGESYRIDYGCYAWIGETTTVRAG